MAQQYVLTTDSFATITETSGTIQNVGIEAVELVSGTNAVAGEGITLRPGERIAFDGAISARRLGDNDAIINVVDFSLAGKGGVNHVYIPKGSVAFANLPTTLTEDMLGWTYNVSDAFTTDSQFVDGAGIAYPAGQNVVVVEASEGVYKYDCFAGAYILPVATEVVLGGIKSTTVAGGVSVDSLGNPTINLPTASESVKGGIKIGDSFDVDSDVLILEPAAETVVGGFKSSTIAGGIFVDSVGNATINLPVASEIVLGGVKSSSLDGGVSVNNDGTMVLNKLFYRKANTAYAVGDIVYHNALTVSQKLVCVNAGTTGSGALSISITTEGTLITDGTVTWQVDSFADGDYDAAYQNGIYRGADITAYADSGYLSTNIAAGKFVGVHIGDYIIKTVSTPAITYTDKAGTEITQAAATYSNVKWLVGAFDPHLRRGDTGTTAHHILLISASILQYNIKMNGLETTEGGYIGSDMWRVHMPNWSTAVSAAFGNTHILSHRELLTNAVIDTAYSSVGADIVGSASSFVWTTVLVNIPNELMIYGSKVLSSSYMDVGDFYEKLPLLSFQCNNWDERKWFWLRAVASQRQFALSSGYGSADRASANLDTAANTGGIRPYFLYY